VVQPSPDGVQDHVRSLGLSSNNEPQNLSEVLPAKLSKLIIIEVPVDESDGMLALSHTVDDFAHAGIMLKSDESLAIMFVLLFPAYHIQTTQDTLDLRQRFLLEIDAFLYQHCYLYLISGSFIVF
jgi:hypothetical protein